ncbi:chaperone protein dnaJ 11, chloroplastic-like [Mangifera indica]|uniref:chaperone protein dnaJ 11, chloroplastic-like n=1 Tax=Mangifera indica TaxID=29780 RepID=UPI001CFAF39F|nr:chaperone protein dnaJ 11, chloroplastic-like [Mangifera indica]
MASTSSSFLSSFSSTAHFYGSNFVGNEGHSHPVSVKLRPLRISAACAATAERTASQFIGSPPAAASLYEVLGIQTGATCREIKTAYRKLARVLHPDVATNSQKEIKAYEFIKVHEAYETLSDPEKRADYDRSLFKRRRPLSSPFAMSGGITTMATTSNSKFSGYTRRSWETDQCW